MWVTHDFNPRHCPVRVSPLKGGRGHVPGLYLNLVRMTRKSQYLRTWAEKGLGFVSIYSCFMDKLNAFPKRLLAVLHLKIPHKPPL